MIFKNPDCLQRFPPPIIIKYIYGLSGSQVFISGFFVQQIASGHYFSVV